MSGSGPLLLKLERSTWRIDDNARTVLFVMDTSGPLSATCAAAAAAAGSPLKSRSEEHTSELQSRQYLVCRLLLEKKKNKTNRINLSGCYLEKPCTLRRTEPATRRSDTAALPAQPT